MANEASVSRMVNEGYQITYGTELEFVLVYHGTLIGGTLQRLRLPRDRVRSAIPSADGSNDPTFDPLITSPLGLKERHALQKNHPGSARYLYDRPRYRSWALRLDNRLENFNFYETANVNENHPEQIAIGRQFTEDPQSEFQILASLGSYPLRIAQEVLRSGHQLENSEYWNSAFANDKSILINFTPHKKFTHYTEWHLCTDLSLTGLSRNELYGYLLRDKQYPEVDSAAHISVDGSKNLKINHESGGIRNGSKRRQLHGPSHENASTCAPENGFDPTANYTLNELILKRKATNSDEAWQQWNRRIQTEVMKMQRGTSVHASTTLKIKELELETLEQLVKISHATCRHDCQRAELLRDKRLILDADASTPGGWTGSWVTHGLNTEETDRDDYENWSARQLQHWIEKRHEDTARGLRIIEKLMAERKAEKTSASQQARQPGTDAIGIAGANKLTDLSCYESDMGDDVVDATTAISSERPTQSASYSSMKNSTRQLSHVVLARKPKPLRPNNWDSYGVELISPPRNVNDTASFQEIVSLSSRLKGRACHLHGATISQFCAFHVHLKPQDQEVDLLTLKHLAFILVVFEDEIDKLMPWHRRLHNVFNWPGFVDLWTNRDDFRANWTRNELPDDMMQVYRNDFILRHSDELEGVPSASIEHFFKLPHFPDGAFQPPVIDSMRRRIFESREWSTLDGLVAHFHKDRRRSNMLGCEQHRSSISLWKLLQDKFPSTIEFRQHEGILRGDMAYWWTMFCTGLLRLANHMAHHKLEVPNLNGDGYPWVGDLETANIYDLFQEMQFPEAGVSYFKQRASYFAIFPGLFAKAGYGGGGPEWDSGDPPQHFTSSKQTASDHEASRSEPSLHLPPPRLISYTSPDTPSLNSNTNIFASDRNSPSSDHATTCPSAQPPTGPVWRPTSTRLPTPRPGYLASSHVLFTESSPAPLPDLLPNSPSIPSSDPGVAPAFTPEGLIYIADTLPGGGPASSRRTIERRSRSGFQTPQRVTRSSHHNTPKTPKTPERPDSGYSPLTAPNSTDPPPLRSSKITPGGYVQPERPPGAPPNDHTLPTAAGPDEWRVPQSAPRLPSSAMPGSSRVYTQANLHLWVLSTEPSVLDIVAGTPEEAANIERALSRVADPDVNGFVPVAPEGPQPPVCIRLGNTPQQGMSISGGPLSPAKIKILARATLDGFNQAHGAFPSLSRQQWPLQSTQPQKQPSEGSSGDDPTRTESTGQPINDNSEAGPKYPEAGSSIPEEEVVDRRTELLARAGARLVGENFSLNITGNINDAEELSIHIRNVVRDSHPASSYSVRGPPRISVSFVVEGNDTQRNQLHHGHHRITIPSTSRAGADDSVAPENVSGGRGNLSYLLEAYPTAIQPDANNPFAPNFPGGGGRGSLDYGPGVINRPPADTGPKEFKGPMSPIHDAEDGYVTPGMEQSREDRHRRIRRSQFELCHTHGNSFIDNRLSRYVPGSTKPSLGPVWPEPGAPSPLLGGELKNTDLSPELGISAADSSRYCPAASPERGSRNSSITAPPFVLFCDPDKDSRNEWIHWEPEDDCRQCPIHCYAKVLDAKTQPELQRPTQQGQKAVSRNPIGGEGPDFAIHVSPDGVTQTPPPGGQGPPRYGRQAITIPEQLEGTQPGQPATSGNVQKMGSNAIPGSCQDEQLPAPLPGGQGGRLRSMPPSTSSSEIQRQALRALGLSSQGREFNDSDDLSDSEDGGPGLDMPILTSPPRTGRPRSETRPSPEEPNICLSKASAPPPGAPANPPPRRATPRNEDRTSVRGRGRRHGERSQITPEHIRFLSSLDFLIHPPRADPNDQINNGEESNFSDVEGGKVDLARSPRDSGQRNKLLVRAGAKKETLTEKLGREKCEQAARQEEQREKERQDVTAGLQRTQPAPSRVLKTTEIPEVIVISSGEEDNDDDDDIDDNDDDDGKDATAELQITQRAPSTAFMTSKVPEVIIVSSDEEEDEEEKDDDDDPGSPGGAGETNTTATEQASEILKNFIDGKSGEGGNRKRTATNEDDNADPKRQKGSKTVFFAPKTPPRIGSSVLGTPKSDSQSPHNLQTLGSKANQPPTDPLASDGEDRE